MSEIAKPVMVLIVKPVMVLIAYRILCKTGPCDVHGYAFEVPGWPEIRACARDWYGTWVIDEYDSGMRICAPAISNLKDAPEATRRYLDAQGPRKTVLRIIRARIPKYV